MIQKNINRCPNKIAMDQRQTHKIKKNQRNGWQFPLQKKIKFDLGQTFRTLNLKCSNLSLSLSVPLSLYIYMYTRLSICVSVRLSVSVSFCLYVVLSVNLFSDFIFYIILSRNISISLFQSILTASNLLSIIVKFQFWFII